MSVETICLGIPLAIFFTLAWAVMILYADYIVAQFDRFSGYRGQSVSSLGRLLGLPWQAQTQLIFSSLIFGLAAVGLAFIHVVMVLLVGVVVLAGFSAMLFADSQRLSGIIAQLPPPKQVQPVVRPLAVPVSSVLVGRRGERKGEEIECVPNMRIGRGSHNNLNLREVSISRNHVRLRYDQGAWFIQDAESATGIYINGQRERAHRLKHGDLITIGSSEFEFREG